MSKIVLCETGEASRFYRIEKINQTFSGYGQLCWLIEHYLIFFLMEGFDFPMRTYLKEELGIPLKNEDTVHQLKEIIQFRNYFTADEKRQMNQKIRTTYLYSPAKKQKMLADLYLSKKLYLGALQSYQKLLKFFGQMKPKEQAQILYHIGLCQSRMFCFQEAKESFLKALKIREKKEIQEAYFLISYLQGDLRQFLKDGERISFSEDNCRKIYGNIEQKAKELKDQEEFVKLEKIDYHRKQNDDMTAGRLTNAVLEKWKDEYKEEII